MGDVSQLSEIERTAEMRALIQLLAARSGQLLVVNALAAARVRPGQRLGKAATDAVSGDARLPASSLPSAVGFTRTT